MIKVLIVDDSAFMRQVLSDIINNDTNLTVVATARNGEDALEKTNKLKPDVITLDVEMPVMDGLETLDAIMSNNPLPIIMLSSFTKEGADLTVKALEKGAIDFITKPSHLDIAKVKHQLINKIKIAAKVNVKKNKLLTSQPPTKIEAENYQKQCSTSEIKQIILIGTSTGGPRALQEVIPHLPANLPAPVLVVQHMPPGFTKSLANRLNSISAIEVKEAEHGELIQTGKVYIAPGDYHLETDNSNGCLTVNLTKSPPNSGHRPSVNVMMQAVCERFSGLIVGVIMTGMGSDGTEGFKLIKAKMGRTVAEAESTCVVYGMPKSAIKANVVDKVVPLNEISNTIIKMLK